MATLSNMIRCAALLACAVSMFAPIAAHACAACGCSLSTDATIGYSAVPGWRISFEYIYFPQDQSRNGTHVVMPAQAAVINDAGNNQEVERQTINRYINLGVNYNPNSSWNSGAIVPYVDRNHTTHDATTSDQFTSGNVSGDITNGLGGIKPIASYQGFLPTHNLGLQLGVKPPIGRYDGRNVLIGNTVGRDPVFFNSGPSATDGQALDTSLQPGTNSTDMVPDAYYYQSVSQDFGAFISG